MTSPRPDYALTLDILAGTYAVCRLPPDAPVPAPEDRPGLWSLTRTQEETSLVCPEHQSPAEARCEGPWRCLRVAGPLDFSLTGVLAALAAPLAEAGISVFAVSTYDTDYLLVPANRLAEAARTLKSAGHPVREAP